MAASGGAGGHFKVGLLLLVISSTLCLVQSQAPNGQVHGFISFAQARLVVDEEGPSAGLTTIQVPMVRDVGSSGTVYATITISNGTNSDFFGTNLVATFPDGTTAISAIITIRNDAVPEGNETFILQITGTRFGAEVGSQSTMALVIRASDEPHGAVQFDPSSLAIEVAEPVSMETNVSLTVLRGPGVFGRVSVNYEIVRDPSVGLDDLTPFQNSQELIFNDQVFSQQLILIIATDDIPEPNEEFIIRLTTPRGGVTLADQATSATVTILANDAPIRWSQPIYEASEDSGSFQLTLTRGLLEDGSSMGNLSTTSTVQVTTVGGSATADVDFQSQSLSVTFPPESSSQTISIPITNDNLPEGDEMFTVVLSQPSSNVVLQPPTVATVIIPINDNAGGLVSFASAGPVIIGEDDQSVGEFVIQRAVSSFSELIVEWEIRDNVDSSVAVSDFQPARGNVTIPTGVTQTVLTIQALDDELPETAEGFSVQLVRVVSGGGELSEVGVRLATLIVRESDDVYGLVEWAEDSRLSVADTSPRELRLAVTRSGGSTGIVAVDYAVVYLPLGTTDPTMGVTGVATIATGSVQIQGGLILREFSVPISDDAFLETGGQFFVSVTNATLIGGATLIIPPSVSPRIGGRSEVTVEVPSSAANGFISFSAQSLQVSVEEPETTPSTVELTVARSGSYGTAVIIWGVTFVSVAFDEIGSNTGTVTIPSGASEAILSISIFPDNEPEVDEEFTVSLLTVNPSNQMLLIQLSVATVTILENDNAAGIFSISPSSSGPFFVPEEDNSIVLVTIVRNEGNLTNEVIQYGIPGGDGEFVGSQGLATFAPGMREFTVTLFINNDDEPETNETYAFTISSLDGDTELLGMPSSVEITILANDNYAGVFSFDSASLEMIVVEPLTNSTASMDSTAVFTVNRDVASYTDVTVMWEVAGTTTANDDISPTSGVLYFDEGMTVAVFEISALPDETPEANETFTIILSSVSGDGELASSSVQASLLVLHNDDPVRFRRSVLQTSEGSSVVFEVVRGGQTNGDAEVMFEVLYSTASPNDISITAPQGGVITFIDGQTTAVISIDVIDDDLPEESELLVISLIAASGDVVIVTPFEATLILAPSDDPNGVFQFATGFTDVLAQEGDEPALIVERLGGSFGIVSLRWSIYLLDVNGSRSPADPADIFPTSGILTFEPENITGTITFSVIDDDVSELSEEFVVDLSILSIIGDSTDGARLGNSSMAAITVAISDDPFGLLVVSDDSLEVEVAEDVPVDQPTLGMTTVSVRRMAGDLGTVRVVWEILPMNVAPLPSFTDLLFFGQLGSTVSPFQSRPGAETVALRFTGQAGSVVTVPELYHPQSIADGFTISVWLQPTLGSGGVLLAKTTIDGSTTYYSLSLVADGTNYLSRLGYLPAGGSSTQLRTVNIPIVQSSLADGAWHSLAVVVESGTALFYVDGVFQTSRLLGFAELADGSGVLTVGGLSASDFYTGTLQDVRVYAGPLTESQLQPISTSILSETLIPISGYLSYQPGDRDSNLTLSSVDDSTPELSELFIMKLTNSDGGSRIDDGQDTSLVTVLKSDSSNGVFGFDSQSLTSTISEPGSLSLLVNRRGGTFSTVFIYWEVHQIVNGVISSSPASSDFDEATGRLEFAENVTQEMLILMATDELVSELEEQFVVLLVSAVADDNETSSTPISGASIDSTQEQSNLTVTANDFPYGLIQFVTSPPPPEVPITPATEMPEMFVRESDGTATVYVVRAQGTVGTVQVEYITSDGSATSLGGQADYISTADELEFGAGVVVHNFSVSLRDDSVPELAKTFYVNLTNPRGSPVAPSLGIGSTLAVTILPSDDAFGRFGFSIDSLSNVLQEQQGGTPVVLTVIRNGGTFGDVEVYWSVSENGAAASDGRVTDISPSEGVLMFEEGVVQQRINLMINNDLDPEFFEVFTVQLLNVTVGASLSPLSAATITIQASDFPYGLFVFSSIYRPLLGITEGSQVEIIVSRLFGTLGEVSVDYQTVSSYGIGADTAVNGVVNIQQLITNSQIATTGDDYSATNGTLVFQDGQTSASLRLIISEDTVPELSEYIFLTLSEARLNESSVAVVDTSVLPAVASGNESVAVVIIEENDDARGVFELSASSVITPEPSQGFISVQRTGGSFGEITVSWEATPTTASAADYNPSIGVVTLPSGVQSMPLPLSIFDDGEPEFQEEFTVRIVGVSGGARLGSLTSATVMIDSSDDPNGALEFALGSRVLEVAEPVGAPRTVRLAVERVGGAEGVVEVTWNITSLSGEPATLDIEPVTRNLQYLTNVRQQDIVLSVLPDDLPELSESFVVELVSATGGARIGTNSRAIVTIPLNDNPYGIVSFESSMSVAMEIGDNGTSVAMIPIMRTLGTFGDLRIFYTVESADPAMLALADGTPLFSYFSSPVSNTTLTSSTLLQSLTGLSLEECATRCLSDQACLAFARTVSVCELYLVSDDGMNSQFTSEAEYYEKLQEQTLPFYQAVATEGSDFVSSIGRPVIIPAGSTSSHIPLTIIGDMTPELNESLIITLNDVEVASAIEGGAPIGISLLGGIVQSTVVILENDDPHGQFTIYGSNGERVVRVSEPFRFNFGVTLTVERRGGTIGEVSVRWDVSSNSTAVQGLDYAGTGAVLTFGDGDSSSVIVFTVLDDSLAERDETVIIELSNPTGGATVAPDMEGITLAIINANDEAAGVVGLSSLSRSAVVGEGDSVMLRVVRGVSTLGRVEVDWEISGVGVSSEFVRINGTEVFLEGEAEASIMLEVAPDATPEIEERYTLTLIDVRTTTEDIAPSGAATLDPLATMATISIRASNNPHGVVEFQSSSLFVTIEEAAFLQLTLVRQFGLFGAIDVGYRTESGNISALTEGQFLATPGQDFVSRDSVVRLEDGQQSVFINISTSDDDIAELEEIFLVRLISVTLVSGGDNDTIPPSLGTDVTSQVTISPNDNPQGQLTFIQDSYIVEEDVGVLNVVISRDQGVFGQVSVVYFISTGSATSNDFSLTPDVGELTFSPGQLQRSLDIMIVNDNEAEVAEDFCVGLRLPRFGAVLGNITTTCVTILPNDDAYGVFSFDQGSLSVTLQETQDTPSADNIAELRIVRSGGLFERVTLPYEIRQINNEGSPVTDFSETMGALIFNQNEDFRILRIEALMDDIPEQAENFTVTLLQPSGLGELSASNTVAVITVAANEDPFGVFEISQVGVAGAAVGIDEGAGPVEFEVSRSFGRFGEISVAVETELGSASFVPGSVPSFTTTQLLDSPSATTWYYFVRSNGQPFLFLGAGSQSVLYAWRGLFTAVQTLNTDGASGFTFMTLPTGQDLLIVANQGSVGSRQVDSYVYWFSGPEELTLIQSIPTMGATDTVSFQYPDTSSSAYLIFSSGEDNQGNPNVDSSLLRWNGNSFAEIQGLPTIGASSLDVFTIDSNLYLAVGSLTDTRSQVFVWRNGQFRLDHTFDTNQVSDIVSFSVGPVYFLGVASLVDGVSIMRRSPDTGQFFANGTLPSNRPIKLERIYDELVFVSEVIEIPTEAPTLPPTTAVDEQTAPMTTVPPQTAASTSNEATTPPPTTREAATPPETTPEVNTPPPTTPAATTPPTTTPAATTPPPTTPVATTSPPTTPEASTLKPEDRTTPTPGADTTPPPTTPTPGADTTPPPTTPEASTLKPEDRTTPTPGADTTPPPTTPTPGADTTPPPTTPEASTLKPEDRTTTPPPPTTSGMTTSSTDAATTPKPEERTGTTPDPNTPMPSQRRRRRQANTREIVRVMEGPTTGIAITNTLTPGQVLSFAEGSVSELSLPVSNHLYPFVLVNTSFMAAAGLVGTNESTSSGSAILERFHIDPLATDLFPRNLVLTFAPGEYSLRFTVEAFDDIIPEVDETFDLRLTNIMGGARLGQQSSVAVTIITNDDAHGLIGFADDSLSVVTSEPDTSTTLVVLNVERTRGTSGQVTVTWQISGEHTEREVTPSSGVINFADGVSMATINLFIQSDEVSELNEVTRVQLSAVTENGVPVGGVSTRGAQINSGRSEAVITVEANDDPHGVFTWSPLIVMATEVEDMNNVIQLTIVREFGTIGAVAVGYNTSEALFASDDRRAQPALDYVSASGEVVIEDGSGSATIDIFILHDNVAELTESFLVNITSVRLVDEADRQGSTSNSPRIRPDGETAEVQITENDNSRGTLSFVELAKSVSEDIGTTVSLSVVRTGGTFGIVGANYVVNEGTAQLADFSPGFGSVIIQPGETMGSIVINITNDAEPELDETFDVVLESGIGGAQISSPDTATVTILRNDDVNGAFAFTNTSVLFLIPESSSPTDPMGVATLTVQRTRNSVGTVTVYWEVGADGVNDLEPASGNLTFAENVTEQSFQVRARDDGLPELFEAFVVRLTSADGGGRISDPREARIAIQSSNDPSGVVGFLFYPEAIIINEGEELEVGVVRSAGTVGTVTMTWAISPPDTSVFVTTTDTVVFTEGRDSATITVQTLSDQLSEEARLFSMQIISSTIARVDINASEVGVIVAASNDPHGVVEFAPLSDVSVEETSTTVSLSLSRTQGSSGTLQVNFSVVPTSADGNDFNIPSQSVLIPEDVVSATITVDIVDDFIPEVQEDFSIQLNTVELLDVGFDFPFDRNPSLIDQPPRLGANTLATITIMPSDDPFGAITLVQSRYDIVEGQSIEISLVRTGGTFGTATIGYATADGQAISPGDYTSAVGTAIFLPGQTSFNITVNTIDDNVPEIEENFVFSIFGSSVAVIGPVNSAQIFIDASDSPFGTVGFDSSIVSSGIRLANPTLAVGPRTLTLIVRRDQGTIGITDISWQVTGPQGQVPSSDIATASLQGTLTLSSGQSSGVIVITVLASSGDEAEETFTVTLLRASNNVFINPDRNSVTISVEQRGMPAGIISFLGDTLQPQTVFERDVNTAYSLPVVRTGDLSNALQVSFVLSRLGGSLDPPNTDVTPSIGTVSFPDGVGQRNLMVTVVADDIPEVDEMFSVVLTSATGGATINAQASSTTLIIRSNDGPNGVFGLSNGRLAVTSTSPEITRTLSFVITRESGQLGDVEVMIRTTYTENPSVEYVPAIISRTLASTDTQLSITLSVVQTAFLAPGASFTVAIINSTVVAPSDSAGEPAEVSSSTGSIQVPIDESVSNPQVAFDQLSLSASVDDSLSTNNVVLTVIRRGSLGTIDVSWSTGSTSPGRLSGSLSPSTGALTMTPSDTIAQFGLTASAIEPHGLAEIFAVRLTATSQQQLFLGGVDPNADTAIIEPWGVIQLGAMQTSGLEGSMVLIPVWRRYGSTGDIEVTGITSAASSSDIPTNQIAAQPGVDFSGASTLILQDGVTTGYINISLLDNALVSPPKVFSFQLTSVQRANEEQTFASPRLSSSNLSALVTILDDEFGAGEFQLSPTTASVVEGSIFPFMVRRSRGSTGQVSVRLSTVQSGSAVENVDYQSVDMELRFSDGETEKSASLTIIEDNTPEIEESLSLVLSNPSGGVALVDPLAGMLLVTIASSDNPRGAVSFVTRNVTLSEDLSPTGSLQVQRDSSAGLFPAVVTWEALYTDGGDHTPLSQFLSATSGNLSFQANRTTPDEPLTLSLILETVPAGGEQFVIRLDSNQDGIRFDSPSIANVIVQPRATALFQIPQNELRRVVTTTGAVSVDIQRTSGRQLISSVAYSTIQPTEPVNIGLLIFEPAQVQIHFTDIRSTADFIASEERQSVDITVISVPATPLAFTFQISSLPTSRVQDGMDVAVMVVLPDGGLSNLYRIYFDALDIATSQQLESVSSAFLDLLNSGRVSGEDQQQYDVTRYIIGELISKSRPPSNVAITTQYTVNMLNIYQRIISDLTFSQRSLIVQSMKTFGYSLVEESPCLTAGSETPINYTRTLFYLEAMRVQPSALVSRRFSSSREANQDYVQLPSQSIPTTEQCVNVVYIEFFSERLFIQPTLRSKVLSIGIQEVELPRNTDPIIHRIYTQRSLGALPDENDCLLWQYPVSTADGTTTAAWDTQICTPFRDHILQENFVECRCSQLGDMAVAFDVQVGYGWSFPAGIACAIVVIVMLFVIILHIRYFRHTQLATRILVNLCISILLFHLMLLIVIFASDVDDLSATGCGAMGALLQLTAVAQFLWILALAVALWVNFMGFSSGREPLIIYVVAAWGISVLVVVLTILIGRFGVGLDLSSSTGLYGLVGDLCFMPLLSASLLSTLLPAVLAILAMVALFSHSCIYWSRWEDFHNLYHDSFNKTEIPLLLVFFALIFLNSVAAYLHVYVGVVYTFAIFIFIDIILAIYAFCVYFCTSWHTLTHKRKKYGLGIDEVEPLAIPGEPDYFGSMSTIASSQRELVPLQEWDKETEDEIAPAVVPIGVKRLGSDAHVNRMSSESQDDSHLDDLMFMLKTQTYPTTDDTDPLVGSGVSLRKPQPTGAEHLQLRRISIADTHL